MMEYVARFRIKKKNPERFDLPYVRHEDHFLASDDEAAEKELERHLSSFGEKFEVIIDRFGSAGAFR